MVQLWKSRIALPDSGAQGSKNITLHEEES